MKGNNLGKTRVSLTTAVIVVIVFIAALVGFLVYAGSRHSYKTVSTTPSPTPLHAGPENEPSTTPRPGTNNSPAPTPISNPGHPVTATLAKPTGDVLNKFTISLSSTALDTGPAMNTSCQTIPGALCGLRLTGPSGQVKQVNPVATDSLGTNSFDWNAKTLGLSSGTWSAQLLATSSGRTSLGDTYNLKVNP